MIARRILIATAAAVTLVGSALSASAQTATAATQGQNFAALAAKLRGDDPLTVTDATGQRFKGRLTRINTDQLTVLGRERSRTFTVADVTRIERRDAIWNGLAAGAAAGAATALVVVTKDCGTDTECSFYEGLAFYPLFAGGGAAIGAVVDAIITKTLFTRTTGALHLAVNPMPKPTRPSIAALPM